MDLMVDYKIKKIINSNDKMMSKDFPDKLSQVIKDKIEEACERAEANGRKTVRVVDL